MPEAPISLLARIVEALEIRKYLTRADVLRAALIVSVTVSCFLVAPRPPDPITKFWLLTVIELGGRAHIVKHVDSWEFEHDAAHPGDLFSFDHRHWQSRPLAIGIAWFLSQPFRLGGLPSREIMTPEQGRLLVRKAPFPSAYNAYSPQYAGYILLNWILLVTSVLLLKPLLRSESFLDPRVFPGMSLLLANEVTKPYFWTPHVQLFNVFLGVGSLLLIRPLLARVGTLRLRYAALIGFGVGIGGLAYGAFAVTAASAALVILFSDGIAPLKRDIARRLELCGMLLGGFFAPTIIWAAILIAKTGTAYSPELQRYHEFIWIFENISDGPRVFLTLLTTYLSTYARFAAQVVRIPAALSFALVIFFFRLRHNPQKANASFDSRRAVIFYLIANCSFYALMGFYAGRLAWTMTPALIVILGLQMGQVDEQLTGRKRLMFRAAAIAISVGYVARYIALPGPFV